MAIVNSRAAIEPKTGKAAIFVNETIHSLMRKLFANNEQGFAYDPNDLSTMFQDAAGNVPVTAVGQPVGLMLDKSKGVALGSEILVNNTFESGLTGVILFDGNGSQSTLTLNTVNPISGTRDAKLTVTASGSARPGISFNRNDGGGIVGALYELSFDFKVVSGDVKLTNVYDGLNAISPKPTTGTSGRYTVRYTQRNAETCALYFGAGTGVIQLDNISLRQVKGNHAYQATSASRPILRQNAATGANYLEFDGSDDFLQTNNIDFTGTDKVSLFAGVRKLSDVNTGIVAEFSPLALTNDGTFCLYAPFDLNYKGYGFRSRFSLNSDALVNTPLSPNSAVLSGKGNISADSTVLRVNGVHAASTASDQGTGNYGNYPLYIGRRAGTSFPFNGHLYSFIGIGRLTSDSETIAMEKAIAKHVGVTLNV